MNYNQQGAFPPPGSIKIFRRTKRPEVPKDPPRPIPSTPKAPWDPRPENPGIRGPRGLIVESLRTFEEKENFDPREKQLLDLAKILTQGKIQVVGKRNSRRAAIQVFVRRQVRKTELGVIDPKAAAALIVEYVHNPYIKYYSPKVYARGRIKKPPHKTAATSVKKNRLYSVVVKPDL